MSNQDPNQIPITKMYESVGRLYLQLVATDENVRQLISQVASLTEQKQALENSLNARMHSPPK